MLKPRAPKNPSADVLVGQLVDAQKAKSDAIQEAQLKYKAVEATVVEKVESRQRAIEELQDSLALEHASLDLVKQNLEVPQ